MSVQSINPATGEVLETIEETSKTQIEQALAQAHAAFLEWRTRPFADRARLMRAAAKELRANKAEYALTMTREMGKPITQARSRGGEVRGDLRLLRRARGGVPGRAAAGDRRDAELRPLRSARGGAGRDAVELPVLAGLPLRGPGPHGGQRRHPQARLQRSALRAADRGRCSAAPASREGLFRTVLTDAAGGEGDHRGSAHRRGDAHRQRARGHGGGRAGRARC